jgi:hypothetical protein
VFYGGLSIGRKLFEEIEKTTESKIVFENKKEGVIEKALGPVILKDMIPSLQE